MNTPALSLDDLERFAKRVLTSYLDEYHENHKPGAENETPPHVAFCRVLGPSADTQRPIIEAAFMPHALAEVLFASNEAKEILTTLVTTALTTGANLTWKDGTEAPPTLAIVLSQARCLAVKSEAEADEMLDGDGSIYEHPDARDVLLVQIHTATGTSILSQPVLEGKADGEPIFVPAAGVTGRCAVELPTLN